MRKMSICLHVRGALRDLEASTDSMSYFTDASSKVRLNKVQAMAFLQIELAKGRQVIPMADGCGNPCSHANQGCVGFDYAGAGCPGYELPQGEVGKK